MRIPSPPQRLYGILGLPLGHSISPALHTWGFAHSGHPGAYFAWEKHANALPDFFQTVRTLPVAGFSVTIPHKQAVLPFLDETDPRARAVGAVNTVLWENNKLMGKNTDVAGFLAPLAKYADLPPSALILGAGGVCRAALTGLKERGMHSITVAARSPAKAAPLVADYDCTLIPWEERDEALLGMGPVLVINATPLGMRGSMESKSPLPKAAWGRLATKARRQGFACIAYDLIYTPTQTRFLAEAGQENHKMLSTLNGLDFFVAQGLEQFRLWTGCLLPFDEARRLVQNALKDR